MYIAWAQKISARKHLNPQNQQNLSPIWKKFFSAAYLNRFYEVMKSICIYAVMQKPFLILI